MNVVKDKIEPCNIKPVKAEIISYKDIDKIMIEADLHMQLFINALDKDFSIIFKL